MKRVLAIGLIGVLAACGERAPSLPVAKALSPEGARHFAMSWSPDGKRIAYWAPSTDTVAGAQLWVANADFSSPIKLPAVANVAIGTAAPASWSPDGTKLAATSSEFSLGDVVVVPSSGGAARRITFGPGLSFNGLWNRDGDRIEIIQTVEGGTIRSASYSLASGKLVSMVPGETHPFFAHWSPDGSHTMYVKVVGPKSTIWVADSVGEHAQQLTTEGFESTPVITSDQPWSPDGKEILYESRRTGTSDLWVVPIDGGKPRQLTRDIRNDYFGSWSDDGKWIAFISDRGRQIDTWLVPSAGGAETRVTDTPAEELEPPKFRPGTSELAIVGATSESGVWSADVAGGKETRLTPDSVRVTFFNIAPDGKQFDFVIARGGGIEDLAIAPIAGGTYRTLTSGGGTVQTPWWSPSGSKIAFASDRAGQGDIFVIDAAGGAAKQLESWPGTQQNPTWALDDSWIYFVSDRDTKIGDVWKVAPTGGEPIRVTHEAAVNNLNGRRGVDALFVNTFGQRGGVFPTSRIGADGKLHVIWDKSSSFTGAISPRGDSIIAVVDQPNGRPQEMILPANGGPGRVVLPPSEGPGDWSEDGKFLVYYFRSGGSSHMGILTLADGTKRQLTHSPDSDSGAEWTPDGKTVVFIRRHNVSRISTVDLSKELTAK